MISTASYVDQVVFSDHTRQKTADVFVQRLAHYQEEDEEEEEEEEHTNLTRIRQRKIQPFKSKIDTHAEQLPIHISDDDDDEEDPRWDDAAVAKVIPVMADEYNSDSGISSLRTDFHKQQPPKKDSARSSDFGDDHSWVERATAPAHNSLMLKTFPGLRQTVASAAPVPPPPPPPAALEPNQDLSRLMREKSKELEKQIDIFQKENAKLESLCNERNVAIKKLKQDRDEYEKNKEKQLEEFNQMKDEEMKKLKQEKRLFEQHRQQLRDFPDKREREEIESLKRQILALQDDVKQREIRWSTTINRLKERIETLEYENAELKQEKEIIERKRLDLMHQLQVSSKHDDSSSLPTRKSLHDLQQAKRPKPAVTNTSVASSKAQPMPKTMVVRNSEPAAKPKAAANGRRTPTNVLGVNGLKNNVDTSRKLVSLPAMKQTPSLTDLSETMDPRLLITARTDSSEEEIHRGQLSGGREEYVSP